MEFLDEIIKIFERTYPTGQLRTIHLGANTYQSVIDYFKTKSSAIHYNGCQILPTQYGSDDCAVCNVDGMFELLIDVSNVYAHKLLRPDLYEKTFMDELKEA